MTAWRVSASCPDCGAAICVRRNRRDGEMFLGCRRFPSCRWTEPHDELVASLAEHVHDLERELDNVLVSQPSTPSDVVAKGLRSLIAFAHPDRWPDNPLAHEITVRLTALRDEVRA